MRRYAVGVVVVVAACVLAFVLGGPVVSAVVAFVTVTGGLVLYERRYAAAGRHPAAPDASVERLA